MKLQYSYRIPENIHFFALSITISYILKLFYSNAQANDLTWILYPIQGIVSLFTGMHFNFDPAFGYISSNQAIVINQSCSGINFFIIIMLVSHYSFIRYFKTIRTKTLAFCLFSLCSYLITILVNSFRIIASINLFDTITSNTWLYSKIHVATGITFYFTFLLLYHTTLRKILLKESINEKTV